MITIILVLTLILALNLTYLLKEDNKKTELQVLKTELSKLEKVEKDNLSYSEKKELNNKILELQVKIELL